jgi:alpha-tubulin suppressor-like RCC1 family protein
MQLRQRHAWLKTILVVGALLVVGHAPALAQVEGVWAWGSNLTGEIGNGSASQTPVSTPVKSEVIKDVVAVEGGSGFTLALRADGTVWAWGRNDLGQLGTGVPGDTYTPTRLVTLSDVRAISAGGGHGVVLLGDGTLRVWGYNVAGQLGVGTTDTW